jgi:hypothetical protein
MAPDKILPRLAAFLNATEKLTALRACIDPALHHTRPDPTRLAVTNGNGKSGM